MFYKPDRLQSALRLIDAIEAKRSIPRRCRRATAKRFTTDLLRAGIRPPTPEISTRPTCVAGSWYEPLGEHSLDCLRRRRTCLVLLHQSGRSTRLQSERQCTAWMVPDPFADRFTRRRLRHSEAIARYRCVRGKTSLFARTRSCSQANRSDRKTARVRQKWLGLDRWDGSRDDADTRS